MSPDCANILSLNYVIKASEVRNACHGVIFAMKHQMVALPVKEGPQLYLSILKFIPVIAYS
jgi:hypothetical protein